MDDYAPLMADKFGLTRSLVDPRAFGDPRTGAIVETHGDDLMSVGLPSDVQVLESAMHDVFECNTGPIVGADSQYAKETSFTKRIIR